MPSFRDELRIARTRAEQEAQQSTLLAKQEAREREVRIEEEKRESLERRQGEINTYVLPSKPMAERLLSDLGEESWGRGNYGLSFETFDGLPLPLDGMLARWEVGRAKYSYFVRWTAAWWWQRDRMQKMNAGQVGEHKYIWVPLGSSPGRKYDYCNPEIFDLSLLLDKEDNPYFAAKVNYESSCGRNYTKGISKQELRNLLMRESLTGPFIGHQPLGKPSPTSWQRDGDGYGNMG